MNITKKIRKNLYNIDCHLEVGAGAGASIKPIAFLVIQNGQVKLMQVEHNNSFDKLLDYVPDLFEKVNQIVNKKIQAKDNQTNKILNQMKNNATTKKENN